MHRLLIIATACLMMASGCDSPTSSGEHVSIRVQNNSDHIMTSIKVVFPEEEVSYGDLASGAKSEYETVSSAYRYAYIEMVVEEKEVVLQPIDYVGESLLEPGLYTYELDLHEESFNSDNYRYSLSLVLTEE